MLREIEHPTGLSLGSAMANNVKGFTGGGEICQFVTYYVQKYRKRTNQGKPKLLIC